MLHPKPNSPHQTLADEVSQFAESATDTVRDHTLETLDAVLASAQQIKNQLSDLSDKVSRRATQSVTEDPLKSLFIAAASGAALMAAWIYLTRSRR
jgi:ElaB/YqjD/DUF883 family membrane-anchored ribosome-binding protein